MSRIEKRLREDTELLKNNGLIPLYIALQGSQNYGLDYGMSDIDTKAIVLPSFEQFCSNDSLYHHTFILDGNEHVDAKDLDSMFRLFMKQNPQFVELLFTEHYLVPVENRRLAELMLEVRSMAEQIARMDEAKALKSMMGTIYEKRKALEHPYPNIADKIAKYGFDGKQLHHMIRMRRMINVYIAGGSFRECLDSSREYRDSMVRIKTNTMPCLDLEYARTMADGTTKLAQRKVDEALLNVKPPNEETKRKLQSLQLEILKERFREELQR